MENEFAQILNDIKEMLNEAGEILSKYPQLGSEHDVPEQQVELYIRTSFSKTLSLLAKVNLNEKYD